MKAIVVAYGKNREIGADNDMPWSNTLKDDLKHFKDLTTGSTVIVGRKTFESFGGRPLPNRENIIVTRSDESIEGVIVAHSLKDAYSLASNETIFVIGGGQIYSDAVKSVDIIYATEVDAYFEEATVFFPEVDSTEWTEISRVTRDADARNRYSFDLVTYKRI